MQKSTTWMQFRFSWQRLVTAQMSPTSGRNAVGAGAEKAIGRLLGCLTYLNEAILEELYSFAAIWNPFKRRLFLLHRATLFTIDRAVSQKDCRFS
jgi:hypothetical protein